MIRRFLVKFFLILCVGILSAVLSLIGLVFVATKTRLKKPSLFAASLTFWICYLIFSIAIIGLGIYSKIKEIKFDPNKLKKPLKAPIR